MNVPASTRPTQTGVVVQVRSQPPLAALGKGASYFVPPMSLLFKTDTTHLQPRQKRARSTAEVANVHAQVLSDAAWYTKDNFMGVSIDGVARGEDAMKFGEGAARFSCVTRGLVTVMCPYSAVKELKVLDWVKAAPADAGNDKFKGFPDSFKPFKLEKSNDDERNAIGVVMCLPEGTSRGNEVMVMLC